METVPISALEHYSYCPRQCALIHVEQTFDENLYTIRGHIVHERVDAGEWSSERGVRVLRGVPLWSERLGLSGRADVVELHGPVVVPVEYKAGRPRGAHAAIQVCAQALCLEEMLHVRIEHGAIYWAAVRRRYAVELDSALRARTEAITADVRALLAGRAMPPAVDDRRCVNCSLVHSCLPGVMANERELRALQEDLFVPELEVMSGDA
jgi:CRISPR-associated exonuclease Cas4